MGDICIMGSGTGSRAGSSYFSAAPVASVQFLPDDPSAKTRVLPLLEKMAAAIPPCSDYQEANRPWPGGIAGYLAYDLGEQITGCHKRKEDNNVPLAAINLYDWAISCNHSTGEFAFHTINIESGALAEDFPGTVRASRKDQAKKQFDKFLEQEKMQTPDGSRSNEEGVEAREPFSLQQEFTPTVSKKQYLESFERIQQYLLAGDCYQVNLTQEFSSVFKGDPFDAWCYLAADASAPYSAFFESTNGSLLSFSPEQFIQVTGTNAFTRPVKGTRPRSSDPSQDQRSLLQLKASQKDQAENLMIVDLLRNDLGKVCSPGSVKVSKLFEIESYHNVHHLVSTVEGQLPSPNDAFELLLACFPGGSITGAPKKRAMEIINELEPHNRTAYCGTLFAWHPGYGLNSNVLIRSMFCDDSGKIKTWAGGGIVTDSEGEAEYQECFDKIGRFMALLEERFL